MNKVTRYISCTIFHDHVRVIVKNEMMQERVDTVLEGTIEREYSTSLSTTQSAIAYDIGASEGRIYKIMHFISTHDNVDILRIMIALRGTKMYDEILDFMDEDKKEAMELLVRLQ